MSDSMSDCDTKSAFVSLVGESNVGKSTLMNAIVGSKISIVTHKIQTTRTRIRGICTEGNTQLAFVDTPGIFIPKRSLERSIVKNAWCAFSGTDIFCLVVDPRRFIDDNIKTIIRKLHDEVVLVINKIDLVEKFKLLEVAQKFSELKAFKETFMISSLRNNGVNDLKDYLLNQAKPGPWYFEPQYESDMPLQFNLAEILREKLFLRMHKELPYSLTVETESVDLSGEKAEIKQIIHVATDSHKKIVIGNGASAIKEVRIKATKDMEFLIGKKVRLSLFVRVSRDWQTKPEILNSINY